MMEPENDPLREAIRTFHWPSVEAWLNDRVKSQGNEEAFSDFMDRCLHSGHVILKRRSREQSERRDTFLRAAGYFATRQGLLDASAEIDSRTKGIHLVELAYDHILEFVHSSAAAALPPETHTWSIISRLSAENAVMEQQFQDTAFKDPFVFDPLTILTPTESGELYHLDSVLSALVEVVSSALMMFAYQNRWFDNSGHIVFPVQVEVGEDDVFKVGATLVAGQAWRLLDHAQERWRFFGGTIAESPIQVSDNRTVPAIVFNGDYGLELLDTVAHERLSRIFAETVLGHQLATTQPRVNRDTRTLPPEAFVSDEELQAAIVLSQLLHFDICDDTNTYAGLQLREWVRGYAYLQQVCSQQKRSGLSLASWTKDELQNELTLRGLSVQSAQAFLESTTFGRTSADLFDAPLLLTADGRYWCITGTVSVTNIARVILSSLSESGVNIGRKGRALENRVQELFTEQGLQCKGFNVSRNGEQYECDAALLWGETLFLFECKNRSLSGTKPSRLYRLVDDVSHAMGQLQRLAGAIRIFPDILQATFGADVKYNKVVLCVLNGLPFAIPGDVNGAYVYDASALQRFFQKSVNLQVPFRIPGGPTILWRRRLMDLWSEDTPQPEDLIRQLEHPFQVDTLVDGYHTISRPWPLSERMALVTTHVRMRERSLEQLCNAYGVQMNDFSEELDAFSKLIHKLASETQADQARQDQG